MKIELIALLLIFSQSAMAQDEVGEKSVLKLPQGTLMTVDGKGLSKAQEDCDEKDTVKMIIKGEETEVETSHFIFQDGKAKCYGGVGIKLIGSDLKGDYITLKGKVPNKDPLQCEVKEVTAIPDNIAIFLGPPCNFSLFANQGFFNFDELSAFSINNLQKNLGEYIKFSVDHVHDAPENVESAEIEGSQDSSKNSSKGFSALEE